ncbi:hypothetical protein FRC00_003769, partial [Tulasnella sp. 408]
MSETQEENILTTPPSRRKRIFEGVAAIMAGKKRVCVVVTPLKALERDQVQEATKKDLTAVMINEDNSLDTRLWQDVSNGEDERFYQVNQSHNVLRLEERGVVVVRQLLASVGVRYGVQPLK